MSDVIDRIVGTWIYIWLWIFAIIITIGPFVASLTLSIVFDAWVLMLLNLIYVFTGPLELYLFATLIHI